MCVETPGVPPLVAREHRGPTDRIDPAELTPIGGRSVAWISVPDEPPQGTPIVILCHERYGVVQHTIELADRFAGAGFVTVVPDYYADMDLTGHEERLPEVPDHDVLRHLDTAITYARGLPGCGQESPVAVVGVCRTGSYGILASAERSDITAVVMLYGGAQGKEFSLGERRARPYADMLARGKAPVLGLWGERDHTMSVDDVRKVRDLLEDARRSYDFVVYRDMPHGWLNDTMPGRFRSQQAQEAFDTMTSWLHHVTSSGPTSEVSWSFVSTISAAYDFNSNERLD
jgi:carboxymethylenebutenolidase